MDELVSGQRCCCTLLTFITIHIELSLFSHTLSVLFYCIMDDQPRYLDEAIPSSSSTNPHLHDGTPSPFSTSALLASLNLKSHNLHNSNNKKRRSKNSNNHDDVNSDFDSDSSSDSGSLSSWTSSREGREAQQEWDEGIRQLQLAVQVLLFPFVGKWLGRKWSYWGEWLESFSHREEEIIKV